MAKTANDASNKPGRWRTVPPMLRNFQAQNAAPRYPSKKWILFKFFKHIIFFYYPYKPTILSTARSMLRIFGSFSYLLCLNGDFTLPRWCYLSSPRPIPTNDFPLRFPPFLLFLFQAPRRGGGCLFALFAMCVCVRVSLPKAKAYEDIGENIFSLPIFSAKSRLILWEKTT